MDACQGIEPVTHRRRLIRGDVNKCVNFRFLLVSVSRTPGCGELAWAAGGCDTLEHQSDSGLCGGMCVWLSLCLHTRQTVMPKQGNCRMYIYIYISNIPAYCWWGMAQCRCVCVSAWAGVSLNICLRVHALKCEYVCVCVYLLQHYSLLLLEQGLELLGGENLLLEDLLHLLRRDHLGTHHGHWHWNLDGRDEIGRGAMSWPTGSGARER